MKFIDENELNYTWTICCDNSKTVQDRMSVLFRISIICAITGPCLHMHHRPSARRLYQFGETRPFSHLG